MKRISIEQAKPGQILAQKLQRHDGVLLAGQGAEITEGLLRMLGRMNIDTVVIEEENKQTPEEVEAIFTEQKDLLEVRFSRVGEQKILMALKAAMIAKAKKERDESLAAIIPAATETEQKAESAQPKAANKGAADAR